MEGDQLPRYAALYVPDDRVWRDQQVVLGRHLKTGRDWDRIRVAYQRMAIVSRAAEIWPNDGKKTRDWINTAVATINFAIDVCERHAGKQDSESDLPVQLEKAAWISWHGRANAELKRSRRPDQHGREGDS